MGGRRLKSPPQGKGMRRCECIVYFVDWVESLEFYGWFMEQEEFKHAAGRISGWMRPNVSHLEQYLVKNTRTHRCCEHFILRNDLRAAERGEWWDKCGSTLRSPDYIYGLRTPCLSSIEVLWELCPSATLRLHIQAAPHYIMKSRASDLFKCNGQYKCSLALFASLIVHRCSARLCVPHLVTAGSRRRHIRCSDFIVEGGERGME